MLISVIIPTYNLAGWLVEAIGSVLAQTQGDFELLIIDDGSTDDTAQRVAAIPDARIRYIHKPNGGNTSARNVGLAHARGEYIAQLDSDDLWPPEYLATMVERLRQSDHGLAYCSWDVLYPDGSVDRRARAESCVDRPATRACFARTFMSWCGIVARREAMNGFFFDESIRVCGDMDAILRLSLQNTFLYVPDVVFTWRRRPGSVSFHKGNTGCAGLRVLERFYFQLGGQAHIPRPEAMARLADVCIRAAKAYRNEGAYRAARSLCRQCLHYDPLRAKAAMRWLQAALPWRTDTAPDWRMPPPLPAHITHA